MTSLFDYLCYFGSCIVGIFIALIWFPLRALIQGFCAIPEILAGGRVEMTYGVTSVEDLRE